MAKSQHGPENYWKRLDNLLDPGRMKLGKVTTNTKIPTKGEGQRDEWSPGYLK